MGSGFLDGLARNPTGNFSVFSACSRLVIRDFSGIPIGGFAKGDLIYSNGNAPIVELELWGRSIFA